MYLQDSALCQSNSKSLKGIQASIVEYNQKGDIAKVCCHSQSLKKLGWKHGTGNLPSAYLVGFLVGKKAITAKLSEAVMDLGLQKSVKGSRIYAVLAGAVDAGLKIPLSKEILPSKERITGIHISNHAILLEKSPELLEKQFKNKSDVKNIVKNFEEVKGKISQGD